CDPSVLKIVAERPVGRPRSLGAERVGFEPTVAQHHTDFRDRHLQPLGHLSPAAPESVTNPDPRAKEKNRATGQGQTRLATRPSSRPGSGGRPARKPSGAPIARSE